MRKVKNYSKTLTNAERNNCNSEEINYSSQTFREHI